MIFVTKKFPNYRQVDSKDCGPTCLKIICKYYGKDISLNYAREISETTREGSSLSSLSDGADKLGFRTLCANVDYNTLINDVPLPCVIHWNKKHFVVLYKIEKKKNDYVFHISDPAFGILKYNKKEFIRCWIGENTNYETDEGFILVLETTPSFFEQENESEIRKSSNILFFFKYLFKYKTLVYQILIGLLLSSLLSLIFPFLTQKIVDFGINNNDLNYIYIIFLAQLSLYAGRVAIDIIRGWVLLHLSARVNISIVSDFFIKLMKLPISFFDTRITGDLMQRINDNHRIEYLLTNSAINTLFSIINLIIFLAVLLFYNYKLFVVYLIGTALYFLWVLLFMNKRKELDYKRFSQFSQEQTKVMELINGMQDIKMHNAEKQKRWSWEFIQVKLFKLKIKSLKLEQWQFIGGNAINQIKDLFLSFLAAKLVIQGNITLGMMLSVQYIIGQLNSPLLGLIDFVKQAQDAKISIERISEIENKEVEDSQENILNEESIKGNITIDNVSFRYRGSERYVFQNLNLDIPYNKVTAIVGSSGSGKTTLLKMLLKFYQPNEGKIIVNKTNIINISHKTWRENCGVVMQEGFVFNDTIANNIGLGDDVIDREKLSRAVDISMSKNFIEELPMSYNTKIGDEGVGLSGGQKQRLFIARAVYKSPKFIFFDEATSSLDANNEKRIMENLNSFFIGRTVVVIAHRLSTVKNADKIIVLDQGKVVEEGHHDELILLKGEYYRLISNQLSLGK